MLADLDPRSNYGRQYRQVNEKRLVWKLTQHMDRLQVDHLLVDPVAAVGRNPQAGPAVDSHHQGDRNRLVDHQSRRPVVRNPVAVGILEVALLDLLDRPDKVLGLLISTGLAGAMRDEDCTHCPSSFLGSSKVGHAAQQVHQ